MAAMYWPNPGKSYRTLVKAQAVNGWPSLSSGICQAEACRGDRVGIEAIPRFGQSWGPKKGGS